MKNQIILLSALLTLTLSCKSKKQPHIDVPEAVKVHAIYETDAVAAGLNEDAADDPAIYIHPDDPAKSWIIGTNKRSGLYIYNLQGEELYFAPVGLVNNVDLRYGFPLNDSTKVDILSASNRSFNGITLLKINPETTTLDSISAAPIISQVDEVYGFCMHHNPETNEFFFLVNGKNGIIEKYKLLATPDAKIEAELVDTFSVATQPEGMVVDDLHQLLYVGEEDKGIWRFDMNNHTKTFVAGSSEENKNICFDIEGLAMFLGVNDTDGYLIASSQGNFSYAVFDRMPPNKYIGSFQVVDSDKLDGAQETDGIDVLNFSFNETFKHGIFVAQDGFNFDGDTLNTQNFKLIPWEEIAKSFPTELLIEEKHVY